MGDAQQAPSNLGRAIVSSLNARGVAGMLKRAGVSADAARPDDLQPITGHLGAAHPLALLARLFDEAPAGTQMVLASGSDGAEGWWFEATADVGTNGDAPASEEIEHYGRYLRWRGLLPEPPVVPMEPFTSASMLGREQDTWWDRSARKCGSCGTIVFLPLPACHHCGSSAPPTDVVGEGDWEWVRLADVGSVFTVTAEHYNPSPEPPTGMLVVDLDGGGRITVQWAGGAGPVPGVGDRVRLVLRKYHEAEGLPHYWWKAVRE